MPLIELSTEIRAPAARCFDLARSVDFHVVTATATQERVVAGRSSGLMELHDVVTWRAKHFGVTQELAVRISEFDRPRWFQDVMVRGAFATMQHDHFFDERDGVTTMRDAFAFTAPLGPLGRVAEILLLKRHMRRFLATRAAILRDAAEGETYRSYVLG